MPSKREALDFLYKAIELEDKEVIEALNGLLSKVADSHIKDVLRNLKEEAEGHKEKYTKLKDAILGEEKHEY